MVEFVGCCSTLKNAHSARTQAALGAGSDSQPLLFLLSPKKDRVLQPAPGLSPVSQVLFLALFASWKSSPLEKHASGDIAKPLFLLVQTLLWHMFLIAFSACHCDDAQGLVHNQVLIVTSPGLFPGCEGSPSLEAEQVLPPAALPRNRLAQPLPTRGKGKLHP